MGKSSSSQRRRRRQERRDRPQGGPNDSNNNDRNDVDAPPSALVKRLRHPDSKIRHAALVALLERTQTTTQTTAQQQQQQQQQQRMIRQQQREVPVWQAVREIVGNDTDLECAALAAQCLSSGVSMLLLLSSSSSSSPSTENENDQSDERDLPEQCRQITAGWALVLLSRLDGARRALEELVQQQQQQQQEQQGGGGPQQPIESSRRPGGKKGQKQISKARTNHQGGQQKQQQQQQQKKMHVMHMRQWLNLMEPCLLALTTLIESNRLALERCIHLQKQSFLTTVMKSLDLFLVVARHHDDDEVEAAARTPTTTTTTTSSPSSSKNDSCAIHAARCLHSALDDNVDLMTSLMLLSIGDNNNNNSDKGSSDNEPRLCWEAWLDNGDEDIRRHKGLPLMARLHLLGCLVNLNQLVSASSDEYSSSSWCADLLLKHGLSASSDDDDVDDDDKGLLLLACNQGGRHSWNNTDSTLRELHQVYADAYQMYQKQQEDAQMEHEIVKRVEERNEPARDIARRIKLQNEKDAQKQEEAASAMVIVEEDDNENDQDDTENSNSTTTKLSSTNKRGVIERQEDGQKATEDALQKIRDYVAPAKLSLEILANLLTGWIRDEHAMDVDDDDEMDMVGDVGPINNNSDPLFRAALESLHVVEQMEKLCQEQGRMLRQEQDHPEESSMNEAVHLELAETVEKMTACLVNALLSGMCTTTTTTTTTATEAHCAVIWETSCRALNDLLSRPNSNKSHPSRQVATSLAGLTALLDLLIQQQPQGGGVLSTIGSSSASSAPPSSSSTLLLPKHLVAILGAPLECASYETKRNSVSILSLMAQQQQQQQEESSSVDVGVVTASFVALLLLPSSSSTPSVDSVANNRDVEGSMGMVMVQAAVLNALMDLYGPDDFFPHVFEAQKVLSAIQACLARIGGGDNVNGLDSETEEILDNAHRFVAYKQELWERQKYQS